MCHKKLKGMALCLICTVLTAVLATGCHAGDEGGVNGDSGSVHEGAVSKYDAYGTKDANGIKEANGTRDTEAGSTSLNGIGNAVSVFRAEKERNPVKVEFTPLQYRTEVKPYKVKDDLSNIENLAQFGEFTAKQKEMLVKNGFFVAPTDEEQLFYIYEKNQYLRLPGFVTTDSVLQVYHVFFDYSLRKLESEKLLGALEQLTGNMLAKSIYVYNKIENPEIKAGALKISPILLLHSWRCQKRCLNICHRRQKILQ